MGEEAELNIDTDLRMPRIERATCCQCGAPRLLPTDIKERQR